MLSEFVIFTDIIIKGKLFAFVNSSCTSLTSVHLLRGRTSEQIKTTYCADVPGYKV